MYPCRALRSFDPVGARPPCGRLFARAVECTGSQEFYDIGHKNHGGVYVTKEVLLLVLVLQLTGLALTTAAQVVHIIRFPR